MKCSYCFSEIEDNAAFCKYCDAPQDEPTEATESVASTPDPERSKRKDALLSTGITATVFACGTPLMIVGTIIGIIGKVRAGKYKRDFGELDGKAKVGNILSTVGLFAGIGFTVFYILYFIFYFGVFSELYPELFPEISPDGFDLIM